LTIDPAVRGDVHDGRDLQGRTGAIALGVLVLLAGVVGGVTTRALGPSEDAKLFVRSGRRMLSGDGLDVFDNPLLQTGPAHLALNGIAARIDVGLPGEILAAALLAVVAALLLVALPMPRELRIGLLASCLLVGPFSVAALNGHADELLVAATLLLAGASAARDQPVRTGLLLGLAAGWKLSGVLGLPVVLLLPGWSRRTGAAGVALLVTAAGYGPFLLWGVVRTFDFQWHAGEPSPLALVLDNTAPYGWPVRLGQGALVILVGAVVAARARRSPVVAWAVVPVALVAARLLADPDVLEYYWAGLAMAALGLVWSLPERRPEWRGVGSVVVFGLLVVALTVRGRVGSVLELVLLVGILGYCILAAGSRRAS
jgi:hypothetical protein